MNQKFDDIRPYFDEEIPEAMERLISSPHLPIISQYVFPGEPIEKIRSIFQNAHSIDEFQFNFMYYAIKRILDTSTSSFTSSGFGKLDKNKPYLLISNHRDISLDPALLQWLLIEKGFTTSEISFGNNLLFNQTVEDIARSNKMFKVIRGGTMREMLANSIHLSEYIRDAITNRNSSVWLAQRNGRTKDGFDATDQGIMKMLSLSASKDKSNIESFAELNILPMAISYEKEPCDIFKAHEILMKKRDGSYVKRDGEDQSSVFTGIFQQKGHVHIAVDTPITIDDISQFEDLHINNLNHALTEYLDVKIRSNYHLMPTNYIAHDMLSKSSEYSQFYSEKDKTEFEMHIDSLLESEKEFDQSELREVLLGIYANCVDNYFESISKEN